MAEFRLKTGQIVTLDDYRAMYPNVSFASDFVPPEAELVIEVAPPVVGMYARVQRNGVELINGQWRQAWQVTPWTPQEVEAYKAEEQAKVWAAIMAERDRREEGGVFVNGCWFHTEKGDRIRYLGLVAMKLLGQPIHGVTWRTMDGSFCQMTEEMAVAVFLAVAAQDQALYDIAEQHRQAMLSLADPAGYDYSAGWPATYEPAAA